MKQEQLDIRFAEMVDAEAVTLLLKNVAGWLIKNGQALWPPETFNIEGTKGHIQHKELIVGVCGNEIAASMLLLDRDMEFWPDVLHEDAFYLHKLVVARHYAGAGFSESLISWAKQYTKQSGKVFLRLDCAPREKLVRVYEKEGFVPVDEQPIKMNGFLVKRMEFNCDKTIFLNG